MTAEDGVVEERRRRRIPPMPRWAALVVGLAFILLLALILLWFQRKPIAQGFVDRELTRSGVPARYRIADLGPWGQRLTDVVIGDPAHPDLVADWVELETAVGFSGIEVRAVRAGQVRMRGRLVDGKLSLGAIDRLMPASSGKPFALPDLEASIADGRMRLETPWGVVGLKLSGEGRLSDDFTGRAAAISDAMEFGGCRVGQATARFAVRIQEGRPDIAGPVRAARLTCPQIEAEGLAATLDATLNERFDRWRGSMDAQVGRARSDGVAATRLAGSVTFDGGRRSAPTCAPPRRGYRNSPRAESRLAVAIAWAPAEPGSTARSPPTGPACRPRRAASW